MREMGPVKEPDNEKNPKRKAPKAGFLASWIRRENSGEPNSGKLDEQDLANPEQDALFNDGFSKRWHKLFSGTVPIDDQGADSSGAKTNDPVATPSKPVDDGAEVKTLATKPDATKLIDDAREKVMNTAKPAEELKGEVEVQHDASNLTAKEIVADVPSKEAAKSDAQLLEAEPTADNEPADFDVFTEKSTSQKPSFNHTFQRVDPVEYAHQTDIEDNVDAPGAPTKGYRGLLVIDHPDRQSTDSVTPPPSLPPRAEAFWPQVPAVEANPNSVGNKRVIASQPSTSPSQANKWPNPANSRPIVGGAYTGGLNRNVQALIDRPASNDISAMVDKISAWKNEQLQAGQDSVVLNDKPAATGSPAPIDTTPQPKEVGVLAQPPQTVVKQAVNAASSGPVPVGEIIKGSPLADKAVLAAPEKRQTDKPLKSIDKPTEEKPDRHEPEIAKVNQGSIAEESRVATAVTPAPRLQPAPLYTPPTVKPEPNDPTLSAAPPRSAFNLPVLSELSPYQIAIRRGIVGGLAISSGLLLAYLFG